MVDGLDVGLDEFKKMNRMDRDVTIFKNLVHIRCNGKNYRFNSKIQYIWLILLTGILGAKRLFGL